MRITENALNIIGLRPKHGDKKTHYTRSSGFGTYCAFVIVNSLPQRRQWHAKTFADVKLTFANAHIDS